MTGGLVAGPALAYPPGTALAVSASPTGQPTRHGQQFTVTVSNGKPGCTVKVSGGGAPVRATIGTDGRATAVVTVDADGHRRTATITARTERCRGAREAATTQVTLSPGGHVQCDGHGRRGRRFDVDLRDWRPHRRISVIVTNGRNRFDLSDWADGDGHVGIHFIPDRSGTWAVIVVQDGRSANVTVTVD